MKIENALKVVGRIDHCVIERRPNGICIGGITIAEDEIEDFPKALARALECLPRTDLDGKPLAKPPG